VRLAGELEYIATEQRFGAETEESDGNAVDVRHDAPRVDRDRAFCEVVAQGGD